MSGSTPIYDTYSQEPQGQYPTSTTAGGFYNPYALSPANDAVRSPPSVLSPAPSSMRPGSAGSAYFTPGSDPYGQRSGIASPVGFLGEPVQPNALHLQNGRASASPAPPSVAAHAAGLSPMARNSMQSPQPHPSYADRSSNREKDGGRSMTKSADTKTSQLIGSDGVIRPPSRRAGGLMLTVSVEAVVVIVLASIVFGRITSNISNEVQDIKTVSVYLAIFVFGMLFQVAITFDAIRLKNSIQVIGVCIFNVALAVAAGLEITQVRDALQSQDALLRGIPCPTDPSRICRAERVLYPQVQKLLIGVTVVCAVFEAPIIFCTAKLWTEFGWIIYQKIGADLRIRSMFLVYQTFIVMLKFCFFFGVGFTIFYLILVADTTDWEYGVTIAAVPLACIALFVAAFAVRREITSLMAISLFLMFAGLVYFVYKLTQVWVPATAAQYEYVRYTISFISAFAIVSLGLTLGYGIACFINFGKGLKQAHDSIGSFGGIHRRRARDTSKGDVLDLDRHIDVPAAPHPAAANGMAAPVPLRPMADDDSSLQTRPQHISAMYGDTAGGAESIGINPQQNATRISLD